MRMAKPTTPSIGTVLAGFAAKECRKADRALADAKQRHRGIHEARKSIRRLKSLLRLGETPFKTQWPALEAVLTRLAESLSPLRDAYVAETMARKLAGTAPSPSWARAIERLARRCEDRLAAELQEDPRFLARRRQLRELAGKVEALPWHRVDDRVVAQALARSERRVAKVRKRAETRPSPENTHRWRRRVRRLRMQWEFQHKAAKALGGPGQPGSQTYKPTHRALSKLSDALGATQDLRELRKTLRSLGDPDTVAPLLVEIDRERKKQNAVVP